MFIAAFLAIAGTDAAARPLRTVLVTVTKGFRHDSIPNAERVIRELATASGLMTIDVAREDQDLSALLSPAILAATDLVIFANTTGELPLPDRQAFLDWIRSGGAFIGIHSAADTFHEFEPYLEMLGGEFDFHGAVVSAQVFVEDASHPATATLRPVVIVRDEYYRFKRFDASAVRALLALHADPDTGEPGFFPLSWSRDYGSGQVFYTALGHTPEIWESVWFQQHLGGAILSMIPADERPRRRRAVRP
jgi:type 1 glutamine amidotransferase